MGAMFDWLQIRVLPRGTRFPAQVRLWVNGADVVRSAVGDGGRGPFAADVLPTDRPSLLAASTVAKRVELGEPECTGGCCGYLSVVVQRIGDVVEWADWQVPSTGMRPPAFQFDAEQYESELARMEARRPGFSVASSTRLPHV